MEKFTSYHTDIKKDANLKPEEYMEPGPKGKDVPVEKEGGKKYALYSHVGTYKSKKEEGIEETEDQNGNSLINTIAEYAVKKKIDEFIREFKEKLPADTQENDQLLRQGIEKIRKEFEAKADEIYEESPEKESSMRNQAAVPLGSADSSQEKNAA